MRESPLDGTEGANHSFADYDINSQVKGPYLDSTLESLMAPKEQSFLEKLSGKSNRVKADVFTLFFCR